MTWYRPKLSLFMNICFIYRSTFLLSSKYTYEGDVRPWQQPCLQILHRSQPGHNHT